MKKVALLSLCGFFWVLLGFSFFFAAYVFNNREKFPLYFVALVSFAGPIVAVLMRDFVCSWVKKKLGAGEKSKVSSETEPQRSCCN